MGGSPYTITHQVIDGRSVTTDHPVTFVSGLFRGSQINLAALTKGAFAIYMSVKKLSFYLDQTEILLRSEILPLKKFLQKNTLNSKVNNWAMELESFNIQFEYIQGSKNILTDTLSRLIDINQDTQLPPEEQGYEFGYAIFEELPQIKCYEINEVIAGDKEIKNDPDLADALQCIDKPIICRVPAEVTRTRSWHSEAEAQGILLKRNVVDGGHEFWSIYLPSSLVLQVL